MRKIDSDNLSLWAVRGVFWTGGGQVVRQVIQIITSVTLARLLVPDDYGLIGMALVFVGVAQLFANFGIGSAIVQSPHVSALTLASSFWANLMTASALALVVALNAQWIATFYGDSRVAALVIALSLSLVLSGLITVPQSILFKAMDFRSIARAQVVGSLVGAGVAITMALSGLGVWSLVLQPLVGTAVTLLLTWLAARWWPKLVFSWSSVKPLVHFSMGVLGSNLLNFGNRNADDLLIGKFLGSAPLGYYSLAYTLMVYPLTQVSSIMIRVLFPTLSHLQNDLERFRRIYLRAISAIAMVTFPMMLGLLAVSHEFILVVLGEKWLPMESVLKVFCVIGMLQSIGTTVGTIYLSTGKTSQAFFVTLAFTPVIIGSFIIGLPWGIEGIAIAYGAASGLLFYVSLFIAFRIVTMRFSQFHVTIYPPLVASVIMLLIVASLNHAFVDQIDPVFRLALSIMLGIVVYTVTLLLLARNEVLHILGTARKALARS